MEELQGWTAALEGGKGHALKDEMVEECSSFWSSHFRQPFYKQCELSPSWKKNQQRTNKQIILIIRLRKKEFMDLAFCCCCFHVVDKQLQWWFLRWCFRTKRGICCSGRRRIFSECSTFRNFFFRRLSVWEGVQLFSLCLFPIAFVVLA